MSRFDAEGAALRLEGAQVVAVGDGSAHAGRILHEGGAAACCPHRGFLVGAGIGLCPVVVAEDDGIA